jgi:hypothetical protein
MEPKFQNISKHLKLTKFLDDIRENKEDKKEYRFLIIHAIIGLVSGTAILLVSSYLNVQPQIVFLYILIAESYVILSLILQLVQKTHNLVNGQEQILSGQDGIRRILSVQDNIQTDTKELVKKISQRDVEYVKGQEKIFELIQENKKRTKNRFYGIWCVERFDTENFSEYFEYEREMYIRGVKIHRLINTATVNNHMIREHIKKFSDVISDGKYIVVSTTHSEYEMVICFQCREGDDEDNNTLAIQLFPDRMVRTVGLAVYSFYRTYMVTMTRFFESLEEHGENLNDYWDPSKPDESIDKWFEAANKCAIKRNVLTTYR